MLLPPMDSWRRLGVSAAVIWAACSVVACTHLLGIDGNYVAASGDETDGGGGAAHSDGGAGSGGVSGASGSGGGSAASSGGGETGGASGGGGAGGAGGVVDAGGTGAQPQSGGAGGAPPPPAEAGSPDCVPGTYSGTFHGTHAPAVTFIGVPFEVSGPFSLTLATLPGKSRVLQITKSTGLQATIAGVGAWHLDLTGEFDCDAQVLTGKLDGKIVSAASGSLPLSADLQGTFSGSLALGASGVWQEQEAPIPGGPPRGTCDPTAAAPYVFPVGTGCGKWTLASRP
jgi:hypothetical protein